MTEPGAGGSSLGARALSWWGDQPDWAGARHGLPRRRWSTARPQRAMPSWGSDDSLVLSGPLGPGLRGLDHLIGTLPRLALAGAAATHGATSLALLVARARAHGDRVAWRDGERQVTYGQLTSDVVAERRAQRWRPVVITSPDPYAVVVQLLAGAAGPAGVLVVGARAGSQADLRPPKTGIAFLSSGTQGPPVAHTRRASLLAALPPLDLISSLGLPDAPVVASSSTPDHGHGAGAVVATILVGGTYVQIDGPVRGRVDLLTAVPLQLRETLDGGHLDAADVATVLAGSDRLEADLATDLTARLGAQVWNAYGSTEAGVIALADPDDVAAGTVGRPLSGVQVRVEDEHGRPLPRGAEGVLAVRTLAAVAPFRGDRGRIDGDRIVLLGRADSRLVTGGEVVDPERLRAWLTEQPGVTSADVSTVPDARFGRRLTATVTGDADPDELRDRAREALGPAHVPATITAA